MVFLGGLLGIQDFTFEYGMMGPRTMYLNDEFMTKNFENIHQYACGRDSPVPKMGYPDMGQGVFVKKLPYKEWYEFNVT